MKRIISAILSAMMVISLFAAIPANAAEEYKTMLPYYYSQLEKSEKTVYLAMRKAILEQKSSVTVKSNVDDGTANYLTEIFYSEDPLTFNLESTEWDGNGGKTTFNFEYTYTKKTASSMKQKMASTAAKVVSNFTSKTTDYNKALYIHDYLTGKSSFVPNAKYASEAYGALIDKKADDLGYARAFSYLCTKAGLKNVTVYGKRGGYFYGWNRVCIDKKWYDIDVGSDDRIYNLVQPANHAFFMNGNNFCSGYDEEALPLTFPKGTSDRSMSYYNQKNLVAKTAVDAFALLRSEIVKAANNGKQSAEISFEKKSEYNKFVDLLFSNEEDYEIPRLYTHIMFPASQKTSVLVPYVRYDDVMTLTSSYTVHIYFYKRNTNIYDYFIDISDLEDDELEFFEEYQIDTKKK